MARWIDYPHTLTRFDNWWLNQSAEKQSLLSKQFFWQLFNSTKPTTKSRGCFDTVKISEEVLMFFFCFF